MQDLFLNNNNALQPVAKVTFIIALQIIHIIKNLIQEMSTIIFLFFVKDFINNHTS